jgi:hypothetical protein
MDYSYLFGRISPFVFLLELLVVAYGFNSSYQYLGDL